MNSIGCVRHTACKSYDGSSWKWNHPDDGNVIEAPLPDHKSGASDRLRARRRVAGCGFLMKMSNLSNIKRIAWISAVLITTVLLAHGRQTDELQKQLQQLKQQYEQTTRELHERIAALEQQIKKETAANRAPPRKESITEGLSRWPI